MKQLDPEILTLAERMLVWYQQQAIATTLTSNGNKKSVKHEADVRLLLKYIEIKQASEIRYIYEAFFKNSSRDY